MVSLVVSETIIQLERRLQAYDPSLALLPNQRRGCWMIVQDLRRCVPPVKNPMRVVSPQLLGYSGITGSHSPFKHLFDFTRKGVPYDPSYEWVMLGLDDVAPRGDDVDFWRKFDRADKVLEEKERLEDEDFMAYVSREMDNYEYVDGVALGKGKKHIVIRR